MAAQLVIQIVADAAKAKRVLSDTSGDVEHLGTQTSNMGAVMAAGAAAGLAGLVALGVGAFNAAAESAKIGRETERVIRTTGAAAWTSADQVTALAGAISDKTGVDDEAIQSGENLLLTFTNVRNEVGAGNDVFNQASQAALDMSTALGTDMTSASIQLGKALNDPIKGITALSRAGVSFTEQQRDQIKAMVEAGDLLGAQKIILQEVQKEFGGAAEAAGTPFDKLRVKIGNLQEDIGAKLIPAVDSVATFIGDNMGPAIEKATGFLSDHEEAVKLLATIGLTGLAAAYAPVVGAQAALIGSNIIGFVTSLTGYMGALGAVFLETAGAEGVLSAATATLGLTMLPVAAPVVAVGAAVYSLISVFDRSSQSADDFFDSVMQDVDTSSFDDLHRASKRVDDELTSLRISIGNSGWGDIAAGVADILIPFHDVENSLDDQESKYATLNQRQQEHEALVRKSEQALFDYATASVLAAHGMDANRDSSLAMTGVTAGLNDQVGGLNQRLQAIAASQKIDLTSPDAVGHVQALYEKTQFATESTLGLSEAQTKFNDAASTAKDKTDALKLSLDSLITGHLNAREAETQFSKNSIDLLKTLTENRLAAAGATQAGTDASLTQIVAINNSNSAIQANAEQALHLAQAQYEETGSLDQASASLAANRQHLIDVMVQTGYSQEAAEAYVNQLGLTPDNIHTAVNLDNADATGKLNNTQGQLDKAAQGADGRVTMDTSQANQALTAYEQRLEDFRRRGGAAGVLGGSITNIEHRAAGGPVARGGWYLVGEHGPELFTPTSAGVISPLRTSSRQPAGAGTVINVTVNHTGLAVDSPRLQRDVVDTLTRWTARNGPVKALTG